MTKRDDADSLWRWTFSVGPNERADRAIFEALARGEGEWEGPTQVLSRSAVQRLMEDERASFNQRPLKASTKLREPGTLELAVPDRRRASLDGAKPEDLGIPLERIYEDADLLVINKPAGLTVHPSDASPSGTLVNQLLHEYAHGRLSSLSTLGGAFRPGIVHRLDRNTSGLLLVTKTNEAQERMVRVFSEHAIEREYVALAYGAPDAEAFTITSRIDRSPTDRKRMAVVEGTLTRENGGNIRRAATGKGREAITHVKVEQRYEADRAFASRLTLRLETGRTHQIRVHLSAIGHSLLGDPEYGLPSCKAAKWLALPEAVRTAVGALNGQMLHARVLGFVHPTTGQPLRFEQPPPAVFQSLDVRMAEYCRVPPPSRR